jgi:acyl dehydratase
MPIDLAAALGAPPSVSAVRWTDQDVLLYHLALGAGGRPTDPDELRYAYEKDLRVLPTFAVVAGQARTGGQAGDGADPGAAARLSIPGIDVDLTAVLHAGQEVEVHQPLPAAAEAELTRRVAAVHDKGKAAVIVLESAATLADGRPLFRSRSQIYVRGEGGFGGDRGPATRAADPPDRAPDLTVETTTLPQQALLYRLCGDRNPLHADPDFAKLAGFDRPILHGLCTYGIVCKVAVDACLDGDVTRVSSYSARFAGVLFPGETVRTRIWREGARRGGGRLLISATAPDRDDAPVLSAGVLAYRG